MLLDPVFTKANEAIKVTLLSLLARRLVRSEERERPGLFGMKKATFLSTLAPLPPRSPPHEASLHRLVAQVQSVDGDMKAFFAAVNKAYWPNLSGFLTKFIMPSLMAKGLLDEKKRKAFGLFTQIRYVPTPAGATERAQIERRVAEARKLPHLLGVDPAQAATLALALGGTLLLVAELRPHYQSLGDAMRRHDGGGGDSGGGVDVPSVQGSHAEGLGGFESSAFSSLDSSMDGFSSVFDSSSGSDGGGGDGDGGSSGD